MTLPPLRRCCCHAISVAIGPPRSGTLAWHLCQHTANEGRNFGATAAQLQLVYVIRFETVIARDSILWLLWLWEMQRLERTCGESSWTSTITINQHFWRQETESSTVDNRALSWWYYMKFRWEREVRARVMSANLPQWFTCMMSHHYALLSSFPSNIFGSAFMLAAAWSNK